MKRLLFLLLLFLPSCLQAQETNKSKLTESQMPNHLTKVQNLQEVNVTETRPRFVRLKGYYRSYQHNDSILKYYKDGIVEYFINLKNGKVALNRYEGRTMHNSSLIAQDRKRAFTYSDDDTFRPWPEGKTFIELCRKKYQLKDSVGIQLIMLNNRTIGTIRQDSIAKKCLIEIDQIPTYDKLEHQLFGFYKEDLTDHFAEAYQISPEDYYSFKDLLYQKYDNSYLYWYKKDSHKQLIHVTTELYITEKEYVASKSNIKSSASTPKESTEVITSFCSANQIPALPMSIEQELQQLSHYNPATLKDIKE